MPLLFVFSFLLETLVLFTVAIPITITKFLRFTPIFKKSLVKLSYYWYQIAVDFNHWYFFKLLNNKIEFQIEDREKLKFEDNYLIMSNHQTWVDAMALQIILQRLIPPPRFLVKKELLYFLPLGFLCWVIDSPFLKRGSMKGEKGTKDDMRAIKELIKVAKGTFSSILIFVEGTRKKPHKMKNSPFKNLLNPKAGGAWMVLNSNLNIEKIVDLTLSYSKVKKPFYYFLTGRLHIKGLIKVKPNPHCPNYFEFKEWMNKQWKEKDHDLEENPALYRESDLNAMV